MENFGAGEAVLVERRWWGEGSKRWSDGEKKDDFEAKRSKGGRRPALGVGASGELDGFMEIVGAWRAICFVLLLLLCFVRRLEEKGGEDKRVMKWCVVW